MGPNSEKGLPRVFQWDSCKPYFCLDTSLNRTLAYVSLLLHRGNVLESVNGRSYSRVSGETVSASSTKRLSRTSPSFECFDPAHALHGIARQRSRSLPSGCAETQFAIGIVRNSCCKWVW